ncbi:MAG TPA: serine hydrolase [Rugosimonospora sp.]
MIDGLDGVPGTVSVWYAPLGSAIPRYARLADEPHYAASTMKVALLVALHRAHEAGRLDLDAPVPVRNRFASALPGAPEFSLAGPGDDNDDAVWDRLGGEASLGWLAERMIVRSSNLAANIVLAHAGADEAARVWRLAGATRSTTPRGIEDAAARDAGIDNLITAADLGRLLDALATGTLAGPSGTARMLATLQAQERREDLAAGLPPDARVAHKNGWVHGIRHAAGVVFPRDADPYTIVVCTTTPLAGTAGSDGRDAACDLIARIARASWDARGAAAHQPPYPR